jgi:hypothetical protein
MILSGTVTTFTTSTANATLLATTTFLPTSIHTESPQHHINSTNTGGASINVDVTEKVFVM